MSTMTRTEQGHGGLVLLAIAGLVVLGVIALQTIDIPYVGPVEVGHHAVQRHPTTVDRARKWVKDHAGPGNRWDCPDGRIRMICPTGACEWAVMVIESAKEVTAFITHDQGYIRGMEDPCRQWMHFAHP